MGVNIHANLRSKNRTTNTTLTRTGCKRSSTAGGRARHDRNVDSQSERRGTGARDRANWGPGWHHDSETIGPKADLYEPIRPASRDRIIAQLECIVLIGHVKPLRKLS